MCDSEPAIILHRTFQNERLAPSVRHHWKLKLLRSHLRKEHVDSRPWVSFLPFFLEQLVSLARFFVFLPSHLFFLLFRLFLFMICWFHLLHMRLTLLLFLFLYSSFFSFFDSLCPLPTLLPLHLILRFLLQPHAWVGPQDTSASLAALSHHRLASSSARRSPPRPNVLVVRHGRGLQVLDLFSGKARSQLELQTGPGRAFYRVSAHFVFLSLCTCGWQCPF